MKLRMIWVIRNTQTKLFLLPSLQPLSPFPATELVCSLGKRLLPSHSSQHISHRAQQALQNRSHCPSMFTSVYVYTSPSFQLSLNLVRETGIVGCLISASQFHIQTLASRFGYISCPFFCCCFFKYSSEAKLLSESQRQRIPRASASLLFPGQV